MGFNMLEAIYLLNSRGLSVNKEVFSDHKYFVEDGDSSVEDILVSIFYTLNFNFPDIKTISPIAKKDYKTPSGIYGYYLVKYYDLFILFTNKKVLKKDLKSLQNHETVKKFIEKREETISYYKGLFVSDYSEVQGPIPYFNKSPISDETQFLLAVQGVTVLGMGLADYSKTQLAGPLPVPKSSKYSFLVFLYHRPAPDSEDPRIQQNGRPATLFMIVDATENIDKEVMNFTQTFLEQWAASEAANKTVLDIVDLQRVNVDLQRIIQLARDLVYIRSIQESKFRKLLVAYSTEIMLLKDENTSLREKLAKYET